MYIQEQGGPKVFVSVDGGQRGLFYRKGHHGARGGCAAYFFLIDQSVLLLDHLSLFHGDLGVQRLVDS